MLAEFAPLKEFTIAVLRKLFFEVEGGEKLWGKKKTFLKFESGESIAHNDFL